MTNLFLVLFLVFLTSGYPHIVFPIGDGSNLDETAPNTTTVPPSTKPADLTPTVITTICSTFIPTVTQSATVPQGPTTVTTTLNSTETTVTQPPTPLPTDNGTTVASQSTVPPSTTVASNTTVTTTTVGGSTTSGKVYAGAQILYLNEVPSGSTIAIEHIQPGSQLYLASTDAIGMLRYFYVETGNRSVSLDSIYDLDFDGLPRPITVDEGLSIMVLGGTDTKNLTGFIYIGTKKEADDPSFHIYVIKTGHNITLPSTASTVLILNNQLPPDNRDDSDKPPKTSYVSGIQQGESTNLDFYWGIPSDKETTKLFFQNPLVLETGIRFYPHIEPLQIPLDLWYFTTNGPVTITVENKYLRDHVYSTTSVNTTGILMNMGTYFQHEIDFLVEPGRQRQSGAVISTFPITNDYINFNFSTNRGRSVSDSFNNESTVTQLVLTTNLPVTQFTISSSTTHPGPFYCQYFGYSGDFLPTTVTPTTVAFNATTVSPSTVSNTTVPITPSTVSGVNTTTVIPVRSSTTVVTTMETTTKPDASAGPGSLILGILLISIFYF